VRHAIAPFNLLVLHYFTVIFRCLTGTVPFVIAYKNKVSEF